MTQLPASPPRSTHRIMSEPMALSVLYPTAAGALHARRLQWRAHIPRRRRRQRRTSRPSSYTAAFPRGLVENNVARASASWWLSGGCVSTRSCHRPPQAPASLRQSVTWAALPGHAGLVSTRRDGPVTSRVSFRSWSLRTTGGALQHRPHTATGGVERLSPASAWSKAQVRMNLTVELGV